MATEQPINCQPKTFSLPSIPTSISSLFRSDSQPQITAEKEKSTRLSTDQSSLGPNAQVSPATTTIPAAGSAGSAINFSSLLSATPNMTSWFKKTSTRSPIAISPASALDMIQPATTSISPVDNSSIEISRRSSFNSSEKASSRQKKRSPKPKTSYSLCHAPPRPFGRHKIQVRARPLLQLQKIESRSRPRPAYELLPSTIFSPRLIKAIATFSDCKHGVNPTDLAIVRAEKYHEHELANEGDSDESHDILALICGVGKNHNPTTNVKILMEGDVEWDAYQLPNGSYECTTTDSHGLKKTVRWVPKRTQSKSVTSLGDNLSVSSMPIDVVDKKFNFSTMSASSRRHPIIGSLTSSVLDICDIYNLPTPSASMDAGPLLAAQLAPVQSEEPITTTEELRNLITATSIWVALCEGWCTRIRTDDSLNRNISQKSVSPTKSLQSNNRRRDSQESGEMMRRSSSLRQAFRQPSWLRTSVSNKQHKPMEKIDKFVPLELNSSFTDLHTAIPTIPERIGSSTQKRRARANTTSTVIVYEAGDTQQDPEDVLEDETEDEDEHVPQPVVVQEVQPDRKTSQSPPERKDSGRHSLTSRSGSTASKKGQVSNGIDGRNGKEEPVLRNENLREKQGNALEYGKEKEQIKPRKKKGRFLRIITCGLI